MRADFLLRSEEAVRLYGSVKDLPIYDFHCHLSPKEIWEDKPFSDVADLMLGEDHYKWRLMRSAKIPEFLITGHRSGVGADGEERFAAYAKALEASPGNPLYHWTHMELSHYFGIEEFLDADNAASVRDRANYVISQKELSPRKILKEENVAALVTTDDPADDLVYHKLLKTGGTDGFTVTPAFRPDRLLLLNRIGSNDSFGSYISRLGETCGAEIFNLSTLKEAVDRRLQAFCMLGCRFADIGIPYFPYASDAGNPEKAFLDALNGKTVSDEDYNAYLWDMYRFIGKLCHDMKVTLQLHISVMRNLNSRLFGKVGLDAGGDSAGDPVPLKFIAAYLDALDSASSLPETIIYTLNDSNTEALASVTGCFRGVRQGAAWWFCDNAYGIRKTLEVYARQGCLSSFPGMVTDSRSFLSYVRHDYFRRIACDLAAGWYNSGEYGGDLTAVLRKICFENAKSYLEL